MNTLENYASLKEVSLSLGLDLFGVADFSSLKQEMAIPADQLATFGNAVCLGVRLSECVLEELVEVPNRLYSHHYKTANTFLDNAAFMLARHLQRKGFRALPIPASQILDWEKQTAHCSHKKIGCLAGLGWIGRNNLLVNETLGAQVRLATVFTNMPLAFDAPRHSACGECRRCMAVCPAGAIKERAADFGHVACFEKLKEFSKKRMVDQYICGVCVNACKGRVR